MKEEKKETIKEKIFEALLTLNQERLLNPSNTMTCVVDRQGRFYFYYETNSLFFWHEKEPQDFIKLTDSETVFFSEEETPQNIGDVIDEIQFYEMVIHEHVTYDFPQKPFLLHKILGKKNRLRESI